MSNDKTGGPAFPQSWRTQPLDDTGGTTLRDYFAAKAMQGLLASTTDGDCDTATVCASAFAFADAMLKARQQ